MYLKISNFLYKIAFKSKQKAIYFELKWYIKNQTSYLKRIHYWERGIGKTYSLVQLAHKYNCPIAVKKESFKYHIQDLSRAYFKKPVEIVCCDNSVVDRRFDLILCEEGIDIDSINELLAPRSKCVVGYKSIN